MPRFRERLRFESSRLDFADNRSGGPARRNKGLAVGARARGAESHLHEIEECETSTRALTDHTPVRGLFAGLDEIPAGADLQRCTRRGSLDLGAG
jgi:hypothetical protein